MGQEIVPESRCQLLRSGKAVIPYMRIRELAAEAHVSTTTILRFCKKMDCDGYNEFKYRLKESMGQKSIQQIPEDIAEMRAFFDRVENTTRYFTNLGKFSLYITDAFYPINMADAGHTVAIILSVSGEPVQILESIRGFKKSGSKVITVTNNEQCTAAQLADLNISY